jgi:ribosomal protein S18 acetylase RimI-like enzyme
MTPPISLRPARQSDEPFLLELFKSVRAPEFAPAALPTAQLDMLLSMQFKAQTGAYQTEYPGSQHSIVLSGETPVGHIWVDRDSAGYRLIDIALLPDCRGRGIGSVLLRQLIADAAAVRAALRCSVAVSNTGSLRFHQRLGFCITSQDPIYYELEYRASSIHS